MASKLTLFQLLEALTERLEGFLGTESKDDPLIKAAKEMLVPVSGRGETDAHAARFFENQSCALQADLAAMENKLDRSQNVLQKIVTRFPEIELDEEINGGDVVEALGQLWPEIKIALGRIDPTGEHNDVHYTVFLLHPEAENQVAAHTVLAGNGHHAFKLVCEEHEGMLIAAIAGVTPDVTSVATSRFPGAITFPSKHGLVDTDQYLAHYEGEKKNPTIVTTYSEDDEPMPF